MTEQMQERVLAGAREILAREAAAVARLGEGLGSSFEAAVERLYGCEGLVVVTGIGKAGIVGQKISATLASTGTPSHFLHAAEAVHGDSGRLREKDVAVVLSHSGESEEIVRLIGLLKQLGVGMIAITGNAASVLGKHAEITLGMGKIEEVCPLGLAPTASTTCMMALGDALALTVMKLRDFQAADYARYHPGGALGRKLVTVEQAALFSRGAALPVARDDVTVGEALGQAEASAPRRLGCVLLTNGDGVLTGILTDADLRRALKVRGAKVLEEKVAELMSRRPTTVRADTLASEAMAIFAKKRIDEIPVVDEAGRCVGIIDVQDVVALRTLQ